MSGALVMSTGCGQSATIECAAFRWGGGAQPGKWHVFIVGLSSLGWYFPSIDCVIDDFGNLVRVSS